MAEGVFADGAQGIFGRSDIRRTHVQMIDFHAFFLGGIGERNQFADSRSGHLFRLAGNLGHL